MHWPRASLLVLVVAVIGCSSEEFPVARVDGRITCDGQPVPYAMVFFEPLRSGQSALVGKQGLGIADEKGVFTVTTYRDGDGAVVGPHEVHVMPPHAEDHPNYQCPCVFNSQDKIIKVEVKKGEPNHFDFDLPLKRGGVRNALTRDQIDALREQQEYARQSQSQSK